MRLINCRFPLLFTARNSQRILLVWLLVLLAACSKSPRANFPQSFSCEDAPQLRIWRARIADNFATLLQVTSAHDPERADPLPLLRQMRHLHLQLREYFMTESMPDCMQEAVRIYVEGLEPLARSGDRDKELSAAMHDVGSTVDRFAEAVKTAMPLWAREAHAAESTPR
ncbi:hypothetical protein IB236_24105 [Acidovorax sp. ACV02]|uniref:hypothetical protein n=1 Tax=Acidovorax sp. ACV02 TaxID=2769310 RepID=UPI00177D1113|nr:hypothetical protein [Acidovorax sp. ACV02]MBD9408427.1 hypothetical protein [Acidovorax sp. ACV02]